MSQDQTTKSGSPIADAVEAGIDAACDALDDMPMGQRGWNTKERTIAETAARAAVKHFIEGQS